MAEIAALPLLFPRLRPAGEAFEAQVDWIQATNSPLRGAVFDEVCELIDDAEWARIVETAESDCAGPWAKLVAEIGDGMVAQAALAILVEGAHRRLPVEGFPIASELVLAACDHCRDEEGFGRRVGAELLADTLDPLRMLGLTHAA